MLLAKSATTSINPSIPVFLAGHSIAGESRRTPTLLVAADNALELNVLLLKDADHRQILLITADTIWFSKQLVNMLSQHAKNILNVPEANVFCCASHTHFAPSTDTNKPLISKVTNEYIEYLEQASATLFRKLQHQHFESISMNISQTQAEHSVNRRKAKWRFRAKRLVRVINNAPNIKGANDQTIYIIQLRNSGNELVAILWNYACHPVSSPELNKISADFVGVVRAALRRHVKVPNLPVLFLQGYAGNIRPNFTTAVRAEKRRLSGKEKIERKIENFLNRTPDFKRPNDSEFSAWCNSLADRVISGLDHRADIINGSTLYNSRTDVPFNTIRDLNGDIPYLVLRFLGIGDDIGFVMMSAEPVIEYGAVAKQQFPDRLIIPVGYCDSIFGYLPTRRILREGGYEAEGFFKGFSLSGQFELNIENQVIQAIARLRKK